MDARGFPVNFYIHALRVDFISKAYGVQMAEKYFSDLPNLAKNKLTFEALFNCYCHEKTLQKAITLYEKMKQLNIASDSFVLKNLMSLCMKTGQPEKVFSLYEEMNTAKIPPDRVTYRILVNSYVLLNDIESSERVIYEIDKGGQISRNWKLWFDLARIFISAGLFSQAQSVLKKAEETVPQGERNHYHLLIKLYASSGNLSETKRVWGLLKAAFKVTPDRSYCNMLHALIKLGDLDGLNQCFEEWGSVCVARDENLAPVDIDAYFWEKAIKKGLKSDFRMLKLLIDYYLARSEHNSVSKLLKEFVCVAKQENWRPVILNLNAFLRDLNGVKDVDGLEEFCDRLRNLLFEDAK